MQVTNQELNQQYIQNNSGDPYGKGILRFATRWADSMERRINAGNALEDVASQCEREADDEGITGFMYGCAVGYLSNVWVHGEALRRWHNKSYGEQGEQANDSGGVINPAVLIVEG